MYGTPDAPRVEVPKGLLSIHPHPTLNGINVGLNVDGTVSFEAPDWKFHVASQLSLSGPKLYHSDGLHLLRGEDGEIGVSFDKSSSRHFYFLGKSLALPKFSLGLKVIFYISGNP
jgi:hypothetical protein